MSNFSLENFHTATWNWNSLGTKGKKTATGMDLLRTFMLISVHVLFPQTTVSTSADTLSQQEQNRPYQETSPFGMGNDTYCDYHGACGPNGNCDLNESPACFCLDGFKPVSHSGFDSMDYTKGCVRNKALNCTTDVFVKYAVFQEPSGTYSLLNQSLGEEGCKEKCLSNCSCTAYATGGGCKLWTGDLFDVRVIKEGGQDLYIRMPASEQDSGRQNERKIVGVIVGSTIAIISGMILACCYMHRRRTKLRALEELRSSEMVSHINEQNGDLELPLLELSRIVVATNNFSVDNKLGEGGFGPVYKGTLDDGQQVAVKRLSIGSWQGLNEFKTEVKLIAKLQHRNLVKLIGCCIQEEEKLLIYEYMPNRSLNYFIFGQDPLSYPIKHEGNSWIGLSALTSFVGLLRAYYIFIRILG